MRIIVYKQKDEKEVISIEVDNCDLKGLYTWQEAKEQIELLNALGYKGGNWRLPTKEELNELYLKKESIGGFTSGSYWSSKVYSKDYYWYLGFGSGSQDGFIKRNALRVRCVRDIK